LREREREKNREKASFGVFVEQEKMLFMNKQEWEEWHLINCGS
jgi:hypothetical protein